jgi:hypothetical protein
MQREMLWNMLDARPRHQSMVGANKVEWGAVLLVLPVGVKSLCRVLLCRVTDKVSRSKTRVCKTSHKGRRQPQA